jgi:predicted DNA-binding transcriptional regulator AlpA
MSAAPVLLLRLPEVRALTGLRKPETYSRMRGDLPRSVRIGERPSAWVRQEVAAWCQFRIAARDAKASV